MKTVDELIDLIIEHRHATDMGVRAIREQIESDLRTALAGVGQWLPISDAPRDGRTLLLCRSGHAMAFSGYWSQPDLSWVDTDGSMRDPTYYQTLPTPPTTTQGE